MLKSAEANAVNNFELDEDLLYVVEANVSQGPTLKRMRAAARGRGARILKRTSNITIVVKEREE
jgi:large subunit ribosomal protein L22